MNDLVQRLRDAHSLGTQADFGLSQTGLYREAADEIERLRSLLGAVTPGQSVADIKEHLRKLQDKADGSRESNAS